LTFIYELYQEDDVNRLCDVRSFFFGSYSLCRGGFRLCYNYTLRSTGRGKLSSPRLECGAHPKGVTAVENGKLGTLEMTLHQKVASLLAAVVCPSPDCGKKIR